MVNGRACIDICVGTVPTIGTYGGNGTRLILAQGSLTETSLGYDANKLWLGATPTGSISFFYRSN